MRVVTESAKTRIIAFWKGDNIVALLAGIPKSLLGVLVLAAGVELAKVGESVNTDARDLREQNGDLPWDGKTVRDLDERDRKERFMVMLVTVAAILAFKNDGVGFITGLVWYWGFQGARKLEAWREERAGLPFWRHAEHTRPELMRLIAQEESDTIA